MREPPWGQSFPRYTAIRFSLTLPVPHLMALTSPLAAAFLRCPKALRDGYWIEPAIWTGLPRDAEAMRDEIFGPVVHIKPFDEEEDAIQAANDGRYGLAGTVFTQNVSRAHRAAAALDVGITWVNTWFLRDLRTAFGGVKQSGIGREGGVHSLEFYTELQNICLKL